MGVEVGVVDKKGAYFTYGDTRLGQGRENAKAFLKENPSVLEEITRKIRDSMKALSGKSFGTQDVDGKEKEEDLAEDQ